MKTPSQELRTLTKRISQIKKHFDFKQALTGPTALQEEFLRAILVLSHAEIECYFENIAQKLSKEAKLLWDNKKRINYNFMCLLASFEKVEEGQKIESKIVMKFKKFDEVINNNNGIKENNIRALFKPLGYEVEDFDASLISTLNSFGGDRGEVVHKSIGAQKQLDQQTLLQTIDDILGYLAGFERTILSKK